MVSSSLSMISQLLSIDQQNKTGTNRMKSNDKYQQNQRIGLTEKQNTREHTKHYNINTQTNVLSIISRQIDYYTPRSFRWFACWQPLHHEGTIRFIAMHTDHTYLCTETTASSFRSKQNKFQNTRISSDLLQPLRPPLLAHFSELFPDPYIGFIINSNFTHSTLIKNNNPE